MADMLGFIVQVLILIIVLIGTIFSQKGFSNMNRWFETLSEKIGKISTERSSSSPEICKKCGRPVEQHTISEAKVCGLIQQQ